MPSILPHNQESGGGSHNSQVSINLAAAAALAPNSCDELRKEMVHRE